MTEPTKFVSKLTCWQKPQIPKLWTSNKLHSSSKI